MNRLFALFSTLTHRERLILGGAVLLLIVSLGFINWRWYVAHTIVVPAHGGAYSEGLVGQPALINPVNATSDVDQDLLRLFFSPLIVLTESYSTNPDQTVWTIALKKDLQWDDGQKLTADDVVFTISTIQDANTHSPLYQEWQEVATERLNERELRLTLKTPRVFFLDQLKKLRPLPKHIFADIPITNFRLSNYNLEPVGSGPYRYVSLAKEKNGFITRYDLEPNDKYYTDPPYINQLMINFYTTPDRAQAALERGEIMAFGATAGDGAEAIKRMAITNVIHIPRYYAIFFNTSDPATYIRDKNFRRALTIAIDKKAIIEKVFGGGALIINGPIFPRLEGYDQSTYREPLLDQAVARSLIAGLKLSSKPTIDLVVPQISFLTETAAQIKMGWEEIGINVNLIVADPNEINNRYIKTRNYQALLFGNILNDNPDISAFWHSSERFYPGLNLSLYNNKNVNRLLEMIRAESSTTRRTQEIIELQHAITADYPAIFLFSPNYSYTTTANLRGFAEEFLPTPADRWANISQWYLKIGRIFK